MTERAHKRALDDGPQRAGLRAQALPFKLAMIVYGLLGLASAAWLIVADHDTGAVYVVTSGQGLLLSMALGLGLGGAVVALSMVGERTLPAVRSLSGFLRQATAHLSTAERVALGAVSAVAEELLFRGVLLPALGVVGSSVLFALLHVGPRGARLVWMAFAFIMGLLFAGLTLYTGSLLAAAVAHAAVNVVNLLRLGAAPAAAASDVGNHHRGSGRVRADR